MATHTKSAETSPKRGSLISALAQVSDPRAAAVLADYRGKGANAPTVVAKDPNVIKAVEAIRFQSFANEIVPRALVVIRETLEGPPGRARDEMARWAIKEWREEHAAGAADGDDLDLANASPELLARRAARLEAELLAIDAAKAGQAIDVTPSQDVIEDAEPITDVDPFE